MFKSVFTILALFASSSALGASCFIVSEISGVRFASSDNYKQVEDGFKARQFKLIMDEANSRIDGVEIRCFQNSLFSISCMGGNKFQSSIEIWSVDVDQEKLHMVKSISGYGQFDGSRAFTGKAKEC